MDTSGKSEKPDDIPEDTPDERTDEKTDEKATYRALFTIREYRALYAAAVLSWIGDYLSRAAVTALVFHDTHSTVLAGVAFAISYLPSLVGGPVLAALAERYPARRVMIACDVSRLALTSLIILPGMPIPGMLLLMFFAALCSPPFDAARSALVPQILQGDQYVLGLTLQQTTYQSAQVVGYAAGGVVAAYDPRTAIALNAVSFALSALLLALGVRHGKAAGAPSERKHLLRETADGFKVVFGHPVLRSIALTIFSVVAISIVPEGLAVAWSDELGSGGTGQGLIMAAQPVGTAVGGILVVRLLSSEARRAAIRPLALVPPVLLLVALLKPSLPIVVALSLSIGLVLAGISGPANALFVQHLPPAYRARAFGVMQAGIQASGAIGVLGAGALAGPLGLTNAVAVWGGVGLLLMVGVVLSWPGAEALVPPETASKKPAAPRAGSQQPAPD